MLKGSRMAVNVRRVATALVRGRVIETAQELRTSDAQAEGARRDARRKISAGESLSFGLPRAIMAHYRPRTP